MDSRTCAARSSSSPERLTDHTRAPFSAISSLKVLACATEIANGNGLLHQLVLVNSERNEGAGEEDERYIDVILRSVPPDAITSSVCNTDGLPPLHLAVMKNNLWMVKKLLSFIPDTDVNSLSRHLHGFYPETLRHLALDHQCYAPLHLAVINTNYEIMELLIQKNANLDVMDSKGKTPLHLAVGMKDLNLMEFLISKGSGLLIRDQTGDTPIHIAVDMDDIRLIEFLVSKAKKANPFLKTGCIFQKCLLTYCHSVEVFLYLYVELK